MALWNSDRKASRLGEWIEEAHERAYGTVSFLDEREIERFRERIQVQPNGCHHFTVEGRYGTFSIAGKAYRAHRIAWMIANNRPIPEGGVICHACDNPPCVNPEHLFLGDQNLNMQDAKIKGRQKKGKAPKRNISSLPKDEVLAIRAAFNRREDWNEIAKRHKLSPGQVCEVAKKEDWPWLT